eukprot:279297-Chlamydomonas_euryale.AAC.8
MSPRFCAGTEDDVGGHSRRRHGNRPLRLYTRGCKACRMLSDPWQMLCPQRSVLFGTALVSLGRKGLPLACVQNLAVHWVPQCQHVKRRHSDVTRLKLVSECSVQQVPQLSVEWLPASNLMDSSQTPA